ncbi:MAG: Gfo/Idh/MocA family oxidoreductase [Cellvibrionaceae bacterium]|nr:Gfo/Idh/MocA family oxidoreductase [Cellvibrionaceae bacterium]
MNDKLRWGILGTSKIARTWLIPAIQATSHSEVAALGSRSGEKARQEAEGFNINKYHNSYEALLEDPEIDVIYNPLPNHLHTQWSIEAIKAGKHILCEKPLGLDYGDAKRLVDTAAQYPEIKVMEAFMYRFHPQWQEVRQIIQSGKLGKVSSVYAVFSYFNNDPQNVRNMHTTGGGGLLDIGCYCVSVARYIFNEEPTEVFADIDVDLAFKVDRLALGALRFPSGRAQFRSSTQCHPSQRVVVAGEKGELVIPTPFYQEPGEPVALELVCNGNRDTVYLDSCNHYQAQVDAFAESIRTKRAVPTPLSDALANMQCLDALLRSHHTGAWVKLSSGE